MSINRLPGLKPGDFGLPDEAEILRAAAALFPVAGGASPFAPPDAQEPAAFRPTVFQEGADAARAAAPLPPVSAVRSPASPRAFVGNVPLEKIRADFPILSELVDGKPLVWLDNAATTQRPRQVIDRIAYYYEHENSNVHRAAHTLAARSTDAYEAARQKIADFIGAPSKDNIVYVRGTTEGLNLVANAYVKPLLQEGDEIILTYLEHHANIVPWQLIAQSTGAVLRAAPVDDDGQIILSAYTRLFNKRTKFVSVTHVSNALGTVAPVAEMIAIAHAHGVRIC
ncbi:MAG: aminotransferase class V-fold PLP-dependent enzyme, partial [Clostridiales bacterium]|nr:aminotransferase class V-fold PLP-dependent enzyme [Clostridiales bacterium]